MSYIAGFGQRFRAFLTPKKPAIKIRPRRSPTPPIVQSELEARLDRNSMSPSTKAKAWLASTALDKDDEETSTAAGSLTPTSAKRRRSSPPRTNKRRKTDDDAYVDVEDGSPDVDSDLEGSTLLPQTPMPQAGKTGASQKQEADRKAMPPPSALDNSYTPDTRFIDRNLDHMIVRRDAEVDEDLGDEEVFRRRNSIRQTERRQATNNWEDEAARRREEARKLPADSGHWPEADKELFQTLAMRGFLPLIPASWKMDFNSLPPSCFQADDRDQPVVRCLGSRAFRATYYLNNLFMLGNRVRDRYLVGRRAEPVMRRPLEDYINWALRDARLHNRPYTIPVYAITTHKPGRKLPYVLEKITTKLRKLSARYRQVYSVRPSIEPGSQLHDAVSATPGSNASTETHAANRKFPVLTGFVITGALVVIVTLDSNPTVNPSLDDSKVRYIASFDFSEDGMDVWNAFAVAITVMRIRKTMLELETRAKEEGDPLWEEEVVDSLEGPKNGELDEDA